MQKSRKRKDFDKKQKKVMGNYHDNQIFDKPFHTDI